MRSQMEAREEAVEKDTTKEARQTPQKKFFVSIAPSMEIYVSAIEKVAKSWTLVRRIPNYELVIGEALFRNVFELIPHVLALYTFGERAADDKINYRRLSAQSLEEILQRPAFRTHATGVVAMLGAVIGMMIDNGNGKEAAPLHHLAESLTRLGARHISYGVEADQFRFLETALLRTLESVLAPMGQWMDDVRKGWAAVLKFIAKGMHAGASSGATVEIVQDREGRHAESPTSQPKKAPRIKISSRRPNSSRVSSRRSRSQEATLRLQVIQTSPRTSSFRRSRSIDVTASNMTNRFPNSPTFTLECDKDDRTFREDNPRSIRLPGRTSDPTRPMATEMGDKHVSQDSPPRMPRRRHSKIATSPRGRKANKVVSSSPQMPHRRASPKPSLSIECCRLGTMSGDGVTPKSQNFNRVRRGGRRSHGGDGL